MMMHELGIVSLAIWLHIVTAFISSSLFVRFRQNAIEVKLWIVSKIYCRYPFVENPQGLPERTNEAAGEYARACVAVAGECEIPVVDLWTKMQQSPDWKDYLRLKPSFVYVHSLHFVS